jgi:predicted nucleic acid-binding protein
MIPLDTNFLIQALVSGSVAAGKLQAWLSQNEGLSISTIALSEFLCGPLTRGDVALISMLLGTAEPFLESDARTSAELFNATGRRSRSLADCQIAAVALRCNVATSDVSDFTVFESHGLTLV